MKEPLDPFTVEVLAKLVERGFCCTGSCHRRPTGPAMRHCIDLARELKSDQTRIWGSILKLVEEGLVERRRVEEEGRTYTLYTLTERGKKIAEHLR